MKNEEQDENQHCLVELIMALGDCFEKAEAGDEKSKQQIQEFLNFKDKGIVPNEKRPQFKGVNLRQVT